MLTYLSVSINFNLFVEVSELIEIMGPKTRCKIVSRSI